MKNCLVEKYNFLLENHKIYLIDAEHALMMKVFLNLAYAVLICISIYSILLIFNILTLNIALLMSMFIIAVFFFWGIYGFYNGFSEVAVKTYKTLLKSTFKKISNYTENKEFNKDIINIYFDYYLGFLVCYYNTLENQNISEVRSYQKKIWTDHKKDKKQIMQYIIQLQDKIQNGTF